IVKCPSGVAVAGLTAWRFDDAIEAEHLGHYYLAHATPGYLRKESRTARNFLDAVEQSNVGSCAQSNAEQITATESEVDGNCPERRRCCTPVPLFVLAARARLGRCRDYQRLCRFAGPGQDWQGVYCLRPGVAYCPRLRDGPVHRRCDSVNSGGRRVSP